MGWTAPKTWVVGEIVTKGTMDAHVRDNFRYLKGLDGDITIEDDIITAFLVDGVDISAHKAGTAVGQHTGGAGDHTHATTGTQGGQIDHGLGIVAASLLDDDHTQYALRTIMTADGDMIYRASGVWTPLPKGTTLQLLRMNAGATAPEWSTPTFAVTFAKKTVNYNDSSPVTVVTLPAGSVVLDAVVNITTGFVGTTPTLDIGDATDPDGFCNNGNITEATIDWYPSNEDQYGAYLTAAAGHRTLKHYKASTAVIATIGGTGLSAGIADVYIIYVSLS